MKPLLCLLACSVLWGESQRERDLSAENHALQRRLDAVALELKAAAAQLTKANTGAASYGASAATCAQEVRRLRADKAALEVVNTRLVEEGKKALMATKYSVDQGLEISTANNVLLQAIDARVDSRLRDQSRSQALWGSAAIVMLVVIAAFGYRKLSDKFVKDEAHFALIHADDQVQSAKVAQVIDLGNHTKEERAQTDQRFEDIVTAVKSQGAVQADINAAQEEFNKGSSSETK